MDVTELQEGHRGAEAPKWKTAADLEINRLKSFQLFSPSEAVDKQWLENEARKLQTGIGLEVLPVRFITDLKEANAFADKNKDNAEWRKVWGELRDQARGAIPSADHAMTWGIIRRDAMEAFSKAGAFGTVGRDAQNRAGSYIQWIGVEQQLGPNKMRPFIDVYEKGSALIGRSLKEFGIYVPAPRKT